MPVGVTEGETEGVRLQLGVNDAVDVVLGVTDGVMVRLDVVEMVGDTVGVLLTVGLALHDAYWYGAGPQNRLSFKFSSVIVGGSAGTMPVNWLLCTSNSTNWLRFAMLLGSVPLSCCMPTFNSLQAPPSACTHTRTHART